MREIMRQLERMPEATGRRELIITGIARKYADNIINYLGGYKNETEFYRIYNTPVPVGIYAAK